MHGVGSFGECRQRVVESGENALFTGYLRVNRHNRLLESVLAAVFWTPPGDFGIIRRPILGLLPRPFLFTASMSISSQTIGLAIGWLLVGWVGVQGLIV